MTKCVTGKSPFQDRALAIEALIQNHIRNQHRHGTGPLNVYQCDDCGEWHFTSKPPMAEELMDPVVQKRIRDEGRALDWEKKLR